MSNQWHIIYPAEANNLLANPSFEVNITDGWTSVDAGAGAVFARGTTATYYGIGGAKITAGNANAYISSDTFSLGDGETVYAQVMSRSTTAAKNRITIRDTTNANSRASTEGTLTVTYEKLTANWTNDTGGAVNISIWLLNIAGDSATIVRFDAAQAEIGTAETTYLDGDQPGCVWNGEAHNSTSTRSALSYHGGIEYDLGTDLKFWVDREMGLSAPPVSNTFQAYALTPGSFYNGSRVQARPFTLSGTVVGTSKTDLHDNMKALMDKFAVRTGDLIRLHYDGGTAEKWLMARYEAGLQGDYGSSAVSQNVNIRMLAPNPDIYQVNDTNDILDSNDTPTFRYITRRKRSTGQWEDMGLTANPDGGGTVRVVYHASDGLVYIGGDFTGFDGNAGWDYGVIYNPVTDTFSRWGGASDINGIIIDITEGPDGTIYACGGFTDVGDAQGDWIVSWTGAAWVSLGAPSSAAANTAIYKMAFDSSGNLHIVGQFEDFAGVGAADCYAYWNGAAWATHGAPGITGIVEYLTSIVIDVNNNIYIAGQADNIGGVTYDNIAMWDGSAWIDVGVGLNLSVQNMALGLDGKTLYIVGAFTDAGGIANADYITLWTGTQYLALGTPPNAVCYNVKIAPNGYIWIAGAFTLVGGYAVVNRLAFWNGATWTVPDIALPGAPDVYAIEFANIDPINNANYDIYLGWDTTGAAQIAGDTIVTNDGNADAYPTFYIERSGGTSAHLYQIRNETTGKTLYFYYGLLDGERLTIQLTQNGTITNSSFINTKVSPLPNSDDSTFVLIPGDNLITTYIGINGAPTITANCLHKAVFTGYDD